MMGDGGDPVQPRFVHNKSGRFECRFSTVEVLSSPAIMLRWGQRVSGSSG